VATMSAQHNLNESIHEDKVNEVIDQIYGNIMMETSKDTLSRKESDL